MIFNKCVRCGAFFSTEDSVCPNCKPKDEFDKASLQNFIANNEIPTNTKDLAFQSGISEKNVNRFLNTKEFSNLKNNFKL